MHRDTPIRLNHMLPWLRQDNLTIGYQIIVSFIHMRSYNLHMKEGLLDQVLHSLVLHACQFLLITCLGRDLLLTSQVQHRWNANEKFRPTASLNLNDNFSSFSALRRAALRWTESSNSAVVPVEWVFFALIFDQSLDEFLMNWIQM